MTTQKDHNSYDTRAHSDEWARGLIFRATNYLYEAGQEVTRENIFRSALKMKVEEGQDGYAGQLGVAFDNLLEIGSVVKDEDSGEGHYKWKNSNLFE